MSGAVTDVEPCRCRDVVCHECWHREWFLREQMRLMTRPPPPTPKDLVCITVT